jgi:predicted ATPase
MSQDKAPFLRRVILRNYKSIRECDVALGPLMLLVGPNGSGKSNFLDALRFVAESLRTTMDQAVRERGGINEVRRRTRGTGGRPTNFTVELALALPRGETATYRFLVGSKPEGRFDIQEEDCVITNGNGSQARYSVRMGVVKDATFSPWPPASVDRLYLTLASGFPEFRGLYDHLSGMGFYNISPDRLRDLQEPDSGNHLLRDGRNLTSVLAWIERNNKNAKTRIEAYLGGIVAGINSVNKKTLGPKETLQFQQTVNGDKNAWNFLAQNMSDGTLRAFGVLVSLFQCFGRPPETPIPLVGIEEPEATLHPAAANVLMSALHEASHYTQVLATSHSPELLDDPELSADMLLAVDAVAGETTIGPVNNASKSALRDRLFTAGELLKLDQLRPEPPAQTTTASDDDVPPLFRNQQWQ